MNVVAPVPVREVLHSDTVVFEMEDVPLKAGGGNDTRDDGIPDISIESPSRDDVSSRPSEDSSIKSGEEAPSQPLPLKRQVTWHGVPSPSPTPKPETDVSASSSEVGGGTEVDKLATQSIFKNVKKKTLARFFRPPKPNSKKENMDVAPSTPRRTQNETNGGGKPPVSPNGLPPSSPRRMVKSFAPLENTPSPARKPARSNGPIDIDALANEDDILEDSISTSNNRLSSSKCEKDDSEPSKDDKDSAPQPPPPRRGVFRNRSANLVSKQDAENDLQQKSILRRRRSRSLCRITFDVSAEEHEKLLAPSAGAAVLSSPLTLGVLNTEPIVAETNADLPNTDEISKTDKVVGVDTGSVNAKEVSSVSTFQKRSSVEEEAADDCIEAAIFQPDWTCLDMQKDVRVFPDGNTADVSKDDRHDQAARDNDILTGKIEIDQSSTAGDVEKTFPSNIVEVGDEDTSDMEEYLLRKSKKENYMEAKTLERPTPSNATNIQKVNSGDVALLRAQSKPSEKIQETIPKMPLEKATLNTSRHGSAARSSSPGKKRGGSEAPTAAPKPLLRSRTWSKAKGDTSVSNADPQNARKKLAPATMSLPDLDNEAAAPKPLVRAQTWSKLRGSNAVSVKSKDPPTQSKKTTPQVQPKKASTQTKPTYIAPQIQPKKISLATIPVGSVTSSSISRDTGMSLEDPPDIVANDTLEDTLLELNADGPVHPSNDPSKEDPGDAKPTVPGESKAVLRTRTGSKIKAGIVRNVVGLFERKKVKEVELSPSRQAPSSPGRVAGAVKSMAAQVTRQPPSPVAQKPAKKTNEGAKLAASIPSVAVPPIPLTNEVSTTPRVRSAPQIEETNVSGTGQQQVMPKRSISQPPQIESMLSLESCLEDKVMEPPFRRASDLEVEGATQLTCERETVESPMSWSSEEEEDDELAYLDNITLGSLSHNSYDVHQQLYDASRAIGMCFASERPAVNPAIPRPAKRTISAIEDKNADNTMIEIEVTKNNRTVFDKIQDGTKSAAQAASSACRPVNDLIRAYTPFEKQWEDLQTLDLTSMDEQDLVRSATTPSFMERLSHVVNFLTCNAENDGILESVTSLEEKEFQDERGIFY